MNYFEGRTILLTGGTGSFGHHFTRTALSRWNPKTIRIFSRDELKQSEMQRSFGDDRLRFLIGDVRDHQRLRRAVDGVDIVIHAAAMKQVPACEYNPFEAVQTNILGTSERCRGVHRGRYLARCGAQHRQGGESCEPVRRHQTLC